MWTVLPRSLQTHIVKLLLTDPGVDLLTQASVLACVSRSFDHLTHDALRLMLQSSDHRLCTRGYHPSSCEERLSRILHDLAPYLNELDLSRELVMTRDMSAKMLRAIDACFKLKVLRLDHCQHMSSAALNCLLSVTPRLHTLSLVSCRDAVDTRLPWLATMKGLRHLDVSWCLSFSPPGGWLTALPQLESLRVKGCDLLDVADLRHHLARVQSLELLDVAFIPAIDDSFLCSLPISTSLKHVILAGPSENLWSCGTWTLQGVEFVRKRAPSIDLKFVYS